LAVCARRLDNDGTAYDRWFETDMISSARPILLVDDDEVFRETTAKLLRAAGYEVRLAPDFRLALQTLESDEPVDLLIVDIVMPDRVNGLALARMARLRRPNLKIIYVSGYDLTDVSDQALGPILRKPVDADLLVDEIRRAIET
jgi:DNA-binding NtrC family response regulator